MRDDFPEKIKSLLRDRVGGFCSNPNCRITTIGPNDNPNKKTSIGQAAHITAASPNGPRYNDSLSKDERGSYDNGIWLCNNCAKCIDADPERYTVALLRKWKADAEHEQYCRLIGIEKNNIDKYELKKSYKAINKKLKQLQNIIEYAYLYYKENFNSYDFYIIDEEIAIKSHLHKETLKEIYTFGSIKAELKDLIIEYELDISDELMVKFYKYMDLSEFKYDTDGIGLYNTYWSNFFHMIVINYESMKEICKDITNELKSIYRT